MKGIELTAWFSKWFQRKKPKGLSSKS